MRISNEDLPQAVRAYLIRHPESSAPVVSSVMCRSESTLRRGLRASGHSYGAIRQNVIVEIARQRIAGGEPGKTVAYDLGFSQPNSLYRLLKRFGTSVAEIQREDA